MTTAKPLYWSNAEWLNRQIDYACQQFHNACQADHVELKEFWADRWSRLERHYKDLRNA